MPSRREREAAERKAASEEDWVKSANGVRVGLKSCQEKHPVRGVRCFHSKLKHDGKHVAVLPKRGGGYEKLYW